MPAHDSIYKQRELFFNTVATYINMSKLKQHYTAAWLLQQTLHIFKLLYKGRNMKIHVRVSFPISPQGI